MTMKLFGSNYGGKVCLIFFSLPYDIKSNHFAHTLCKYSGKGHVWKKVLVDADFVFKNICNLVAHVGCCCHQFWGQNVVSGNMSATSL